MLIKPGSGRIYGATTHRCWLTCDSFVTGYFAGSYQKEWEKYMYVMMCSSTSVSKISLVLNTLNHVIVACTMPLFFSSVLTASAAQCESSSPLLTHASHGYISSYVAKQTGCGNMNHPWIIEVLPGQRVNISLTTFHGLKQKSHKRCNPLG